MDVGAEVVQSRTPGAEQRQRGGERELHDQRVAAPLDLANRPAAGPAFMKAAPMLGSQGSGRQSVSGRSRRMS